MRWKRFLQRPWRRRGPFWLPEVLPELDDHILRDLGFVCDRGPGRSHIWPLAG